MYPKNNSEEKQGKDAESNQNSNATEVIVIEEIADEQPSPQENEPIVEFPDQSSDEDSQQVDSQDQTTGFHPTGSFLSTDSNRFSADSKTASAPRTKKYHYYPIKCDICNKKFPPKELKKHIEQHHSRRTTSDQPGQLQAASSKDDGGWNSGVAGSASLGSVPKSLRTCYICGKLYGSHSVRIHEPKCLEKWRIQNEALPVHMRAPEPVKPERGSSLEGNEDDSAPECEPVVQKAFQDHLDSLVPCGHCSRKFSPDRVQKHESCCIEKPKYRVCIGPPDGEIPR